MIEYTIPFPPSVNNLFLNSRGRGRVLSPAYRAWKDLAGWQLKGQNPKPIGCRAFVQIDLDQRRNGDADNRAKAVMDLLVEHGVLAGDTKKHVRRVSIGWENVTECRVSLCEAAA